MSVSDERKKIISWRTLPSKRGRGERKRERGREGVRERERESERERERLFSHNKLGQKKTK